jgi:PAS domain S-box-containing protein
MQTNQKPRQTSVLLYIIVGLILGLLIAVIATLLTLYFSGSEITVNSFFNLQFLNPLFLLLDVYSLVLAILFGFYALQKNKTAQAQAQYQRMNQKRSAEIQLLNDRMQDQENKFKDLEAIISRGKQEWEATFDAVKDLIILTDENGKILRCNRITGEAFQVGYSQIIGKQIDQLFMGITGDEQEKIPLEKSEIRFQTLDGWFDASRTFLKLDNQEGGWVYVFSNVSDRKRVMLDLQRLNQFYEQLVKNNPIAIVTLNLDDRIVDCNPAFEKLFGFDKREAQGRELDTLISPSDLVGETRSLTELVRQGETVHKLTQRKQKSGELVQVELFGFPVILGGKQIGSLGLYHDVSELFGMEHEMAVAPQTVDTGEWLPESRLEPTPEAEEIQLESAAIEEPPAVEEQVAESAAEEEFETTVPAEAKEVGSEEEIVTESETLMQAMEDVPEAEQLQGENVQEAAEVEKSTEQELQAESGQEQPIAEETAEFSDTVTTRLTPVSEIEGIGQVYTQKLAEIGIKSTADLLKYGKDRKGREELVEKLQVSDKLVLKWVNMADLMRIPGIGEQFSELLEKAGVDTVKELRNRNPKKLQAALAVSNEMHHLVKRLPSLSDVENWVETAKEIEPLISY